VLSSTLNRASRSRRARRLVEGIPITRQVVDRFVAGEAVPHAVATSSMLRDQGRSVTIDVLGEDVIDLANARATTDAYIGLLSALADADCARSTDVSLKLSAVGQALPDNGHEVAAAHAHEICAAADAVGATVTLDMEDHTTVDSTLGIGELLRCSYSTTGNVLQSNLQRTPGDIAALGTTSVRVRLVKGAYREPSTVAHQRKVDVDSAYVRDLDALMASSCYPMVGTHDPVMLQHATISASRHGRGPSAWEVQMLLGVRSDLQQETVEQGTHLRVYVPFGTDWYGYFMRRLAERPANVAFFLRALAHR
jgi:proline dehydrogenase